MHRGRYLAAAVLRAANVAYALRPLREPGYTAALSLAAAWPTTELPLQCLAAQAASTSWAVRRGALSSPTGRLGTALNVASAAGLMELERRARRASHALEAALIAGLGADRYAEIVAESGTVEESRPPSAMMRTWRAHRRYAHESNISYGPHGRANLLDVWRRPDAATGPPAPVLLQVPGGGYVVGNKQGQGYPLMSTLVEAGWVCVSVSYRPAQKASWPAQIIDVKRAIAWVREHIAEYGGDPDFIAITGGSAGAQLVALAALSPGDAVFQPGFEDADTTLQAAVPFYGIYDWTQPELWPAMQAYLLRYGVMTTPYDDAPWLYEQASPAARIGSDPPPFFVLHGQNDLFAPASGARRFAARLREAGGTVVYAELPGAQHAFDVLGSPRAAYSARAVARFLTVVHRDRRPPGDPDAANQPRKGERL